MDNLHCRSVHVTSGSISSLKRKNNENQIKFIQSYWFFYSFFLINYLKEVNKAK